MRTRMMKGLFNYETAYKRYTRGFLKSLVKDNIQYAEIRPNFMASNQLFTDDGENQIDNRGIMKIIITEVETFKNEMAAEGKFFGGLKVIYCTPRSLEPELVERALDECIAFKKEWPEWIAGMGTWFPLRYVNAYAQGITVLTYKQDSIWPERKPKANL